MSDNIKEKLKKIFEGKKSSGDSEPQKAKHKKTRKKSKKARKSNVCGTCHENIIENENKDALRYQNTFHQIQTKNYCDRHEDTYSNHKCKPSWCGDCGFLMKYEIEISE